MAKMPCGSKRGVAVRTLDENLTVPVTCKIRVLPTVEKTVAYARMIEAAGCSVRRAAASDGPLRRHWLIVPSDGLCARNPPPP